MWYPLTQDPGSRALSPITPWCHVLSAAVWLRTRQPGFTCTSTIPLLPLAFKLSFSSRYNSPWGLLKEHSQWLLSLT